MTVPEAFQSALQLHQAGRLTEAEALYRQILAVHPNHPDAWHLLGVIAHQTGRHDLAVKWIRQAIVLDPNHAAAHSNLGETCRALGRLEEAVAACRRAIELQPDFTAAHNNLGNAFCNQGYLDEAIAAYHRALQLQPEYAEAHNNLGNALRDQGRLDEAVAAFRRALQIRPEYAEAHFNLGNALREQGHLDEAIAVYHRALELQPEYAEAHNNLGTALRDLDHLDEAVAAFRRAIQIKPEYAEAHSNLGTALRDQGHLDETVAAYHRALQIKPEYAEAKWNNSLLLLFRGDFEAGWSLHESRWDCEHLRLSKRNFPQPLWKGEPLDGQWVLIHAEQGLGDTLQFVRYAPLVAQRGGHVIVECQPGLEVLLRSVAGVAQIIGHGESLPAFDLHCPMMSLPLAFGTRVESIPAAIPYLHADAQKVARWRERLAQAQGLAGKGDSSHHRPLKIGLVWEAGERLHPPKLRPVNRRRSMRLSQFAPLAGVPGVVFVSLQKGEPAKQAQTPPEGMRLLDWTDELEDFADTAALVECLDLVISVDTAVAHLTGALGQPVWLLNRFDTDWRWLLERADSPWYPTMRLFRQPRFMDWEPVIADVRKQLEVLAGSREQIAENKP